ncbi:MAG: hypothetical protein WKF94_17655, partial [Solirubrobacteraceae bacterium]
APAPGAEGSGISGLQEAFLILGGVMLVVGIGVAITRDARRNAPVEPRHGASDSTAGGVGERKKGDPRAAQKQKAAAKRARQARKKNRPTRK